MSGPKPYESRWSDVNGLRMHALASTDAPPDASTVVLVHGQVVSSRYMRPLIERLAPHLQVFAPDLPGYGRSEGPPRTPDTAGLADWLAAWMDENGLARPALLGNSFGCQIIADFAIRHPHRLERAVLQGPTVDPHSRKVPHQISLWILNATREPFNALGLIILRDYLAAGTMRSLHTFMHLMEDRMEEKLPQMRVPTLVVRGARDPTVSERWAEEAVAMLPQGRLVVVPGAAHTMNYNWPDELAAAVLPFLQEARLAWRGVHDVVRR